MGFTEPSHHLWAKVPVQVDHNHRLAPRDRSGGLGREMRGLPGAGRTEHDRVSPARGSRELELTEPQFRGTVGRRRCRRPGSGRDRTHPSAPPSRERPGSMPHHPSRPVRGPAPIHGQADPHRVRQPVAQGPVRCDDPTARCHTERVGTASMDPEGLYSEPAALLHERTQSRKFRGKGPFLTKESSIQRAGPELPHQAGPVAGRAEGRGDREHRAGRSDGFLGEGAEQTRRSDGDHGDRGSGARLEHSARGGARAFEGYGQRTIPLRALGDRAAGRVDRGRVTAGHESPRAPGPRAPRPRRPVGSAR